MAFKSSLLLCLCLALAAGAAAGAGERRSCLAPCKRLLQYDGLRPANACARPALPQHVS